jgi:NAD(P)-dependent dehydrogenase (short-subunit alcohol dehydrogenase family)
LNAVTKWVATACKSDHIQVNAVCPGWVQSDMGGSQAPRSLENGTAQIVEIATNLPRDITGKFIEDGRILRW